MTTRITTKVSAEQSNPWPSCMASKIVEQSKPCPSPCYETVPNTTCYSHIEINFGNPATLRHAQSGWQSISHLAIMQACSTQVSLGSARKNGLIPHSYRMCVSLPGLTSPQPCIEQSQSPCRISPPPDTEAQESSKLHCRNTNRSTPPTRQHLKPVMCVFITKSALRLSPLQS